MLHDDSTDKGAGRPFQKICSTTYMTGLHEFIWERSRMWCNWKRDVLFTEGGGGREGWRSESGNGRRALVKKNTMKRYAYGTKINVGSRYKTSQKEYRAQEKYIVLKNARVALLPTFWEIWMKYFYRKKLEEKKETMCFSYVHEPLKNLSKKIKYILFGW